MNNKIYAVLTGDIVKSRDLSSDQTKKLQQRLKSAAMDFQTVFAETVVGKLGITRGDGWQVALQRPEYALRFALFIRAVVKAEFQTDTRVSIGIGPVDRLEKNNIVESTGMAFELSGHGLEMLPGNRRIDLCTESDDSRDRLIVKLLDCLVSKWNQKNSFVMAHTLLNKTQEQIADLSPVNEKTKKKPVRQTIQKMQKNLGFGVIQETFDYVEKATSGGCYRP